MVTYTVFKGSESGEIIKTQNTRPLGPKDVLVKITHSGLCGTELHVKHVPMALGHEGAGIVEEVGDATNILKKGDRVGWGFQHGSCNTCKHCIQGRDNYCLSRQVYSESDFDQGSMGSHAIWPETALIPIPSNIELEHAAPLMCAGVTVFAALRDNDIKPWSRVGVIGIGGLGHLAIQFAAKMGCEVIVFSSTDSKREEAMKLGATEFYATKEVKELQLENGPLDFLLVTAASQPNWGLYVPVMERRGEIILLTGDGQELKVPSMPVLLNGLAIRGSAVGSKGAYQEMFRFAAQHGIKPMNQTFPMTLPGINEAFNALENRTMRYRGVLVAA